MDPVGVFGLESAPVVSLSVSEDPITESRALAAGDTHGHVLLFDLRSMAHEQTSYRHNGAVKSVLLLKNYLVSGGGSDNTISICNLAGDSSIRVATAPSNTIVPKLDLKNSL
jgi:WD40 repeat protein